ncbi:MAG: SAM-dependent methyltransferase [Candidatus Thiodiazotropha sp.]
MPGRPPYLSLALLSASALGYEVLLMRLFSIIQWHHFAYLVIALALMGYGVSGSLLTLLQASALRRYARWYIAAILLFACTSLAAFLLAQSIDFNIEALLWDSHQVFRRAGVILLLLLPFVFAAGAVCLSFMAYADTRVSTIYAFDLLGAGLGALGIVGLLYLLLPERILPLISLLGLVAAALALWELKLPRKGRLLTLLALSAMLLLAIAPHVSLILSPYKGLAQTLQIKGTRILERRSSPLGDLTVVASDEVPLRHVPGLSLAASSLPPRQFGLFTDADDMSAITAYPADVNALAYLDQTGTALAYHLQRPRSLLVIGSGTGSDLLLAHYHQVDAIDALELNPQIVDLIEGPYAEFAGRVYQNPQTRVHIAEARDFLTHTARRYDLIQIALVDAAGASSSGLYALNESYLYTREALQLFLDHLNPGGYLSITRWIKLPPRDTLKLFATAVQALRASGASDIEQRLVMIRSWQTGTLLVKNGRFGDAELAAAGRFCDARFFDLAYIPGLSREQSNRYNLLPQPYFFEATRALIGADAADFFSDYKFDIRPATDDRPYFHHFFKWASFLEAYRLRGQGGMPLIEWGHVVLLVTLALTLVLSALLILLPLLGLRRRAPATATGGTTTWRVLIYFTAIGLAFLFVEIAFIQKFQLFLHHPIHAIAISLTGFLVFAGLGSLTSGRLSARFSRRSLATAAIAGIGLFAVSYLLSLGVLFSQFGSLPVSVKMALSLLLIAPLAFLMGMPFPLAIAVLRQADAARIPWAWGINGYASVISSSLATLIAVHAGFSSVIVAAVGLYLLALIAFPASPTDRVIR